MRRSPASLAGRQANLISRSRLTAAPIRAWRSLRKDIAKAARGKRAHGRIDKARSGPRKADAIWWIPGGVAGRNGSGRILRRRWSTLRAATRRRVRAGSLRGARGAGRSRPEGHGKSVKRWRQFHLSVPWLRWSQIVVPRSWPRSWIPRSRLDFEELRASPTWLAGQGPTSSSPRQASLRKRTARADLRASSWLRETLRSDRGGSTGGGPCNLTMSGKQRAIATLQAYAPNASRFGRRGIAAKGSSGSAGVCL